MHDPNEPIIPTFGIVRFRLPCLEYALSLDMTGGFRLSKALLVAYSKYWLILPPECLSKALFQFSQ